MPRPSGAASEHAASETNEKYGGRWENGGQTDPTISNYFRVKNSSLSSPTFNLFRIDFVVREGNDLLFYVIMF